MSLFIGRLSQSTRTSDLESIFTRYGKITRCDVKSGMNHCFGFVEYEDKRDAEDAMKSENGRELNGSRMAIEWAKGPGRRDSDDCFRCGRTGHWARDCPGGDSRDRDGRDSRDRRRSRSRSPRRRSRSRSRSPPRRSSRRSPSPDARRRSPSPRRKDDSPRRSPSPRRRDD